MVQAAWGIWGAVEQVLGGIGSSSQEDGGLQRGWGTGCSWCLECSGAAQGA